MAIRKKVVLEHSIQKMYSYAHEKGEEGSFSGEQHFCVNREVFVFLGHRSKGSRNGRGVGVSVGADLLHQTGQGKEKAANP